MGRILNSPKKKQYVASPSSFDTKHGPAIRWKIGYDVSLCTEDMQAMLEGDDELLKQTVRCHIGMLQGQAGAPVQPGAQDDGISEIERQGTEGLDLDRFVG